MKFFSFDHAYVIAFTALVMMMFSLNTTEVRMLDWILMYGIMLANNRLNFRRETSMFSKDEAESIK